MEVLDRALLSQIPKYQQVWVEEMGGMSKKVFLAMEAQARGKGLGLEEEEGAFYSREGEGGFSNRWDPVRMG